MSMKSIVFATLGMLIAAVPAWAVAPTVRLLQPVGGQRGTEVTVTLTGQRLADIRDILFYQPGITVTRGRQKRDGSDFGGLGYWDTQQQKRDRILAAWGTEEVA